MRNISRVDREMIQEELESLEKKLDVEGHNNKLSEQAQDLREVLIKVYNVGPKSDYFSRINNLIDQENKRTYIGRFSGKTFRLRFSYGHLFNSRIYGSENKNIRITWRFNSKGRIELIDSLLFPEWEIINILDVNDNNKDLEWSCAGARYNLFPKRIKEINPGFMHLGERIKYQSLIRFGYGDVKELMNELSKERISDFKKRKSDERSLKELKSDSEIINILSNICCLNPSINLIKKSSMIIVY